MQPLIGAAGGQAGGQIMTVCHHERSERGSCADLGVTGAAQPAVVILLLSGRQDFCGTANQRRLPGSVDGDAIAQCLDLLLISAVPPVVIGSLIRVSDDRLGRPDGHITEGVLDLGLTQPDQ